MQTRRALPTALLVLVVWCAQVTGMQRGFVCDCGGVERVTRLDHCHGPHDHPCDHEEHESTPHGQDDHDADEPLHEHPALIESLQAEKAAAAAFISSPAPILVLLPLDAFFVSDLLSPKTSQFHPPRESSRAGPYWPPRLSHTISLLI